MPRLPVVVSTFTLLILTGCSSSSNPPVPASTPSLGSVSALRPELAYGKGSTQRTGTAFAVRSKSGQKYVVTAAHLYHDDEWPTMQTITLSTMDDKVVARCKGVPLYVGKYTEDSPHSKAWIRDYSEDLMITPLAEDSTTEPLSLAANNPVRDELVWVVGCEANKPGSQKLYPCRVVRVSAKDFQYAALNAFDPWDFSGGPVVNQEGEVVGNLVASSSSVLLGTTVSVIRQRFKELQIQVE
jgi:hypothetical protein